DGERVAHHGGALVVAEGLLGHGEFVGERGRRGHSGTLTIPRPGAVGGRGHRDRATPTVARRGGGWCRAGGGRPPGRPRPLRAHPGWWPRMCPRVRTRSAEARFPRAGRSNPAVAAPAGTSDRAQ